MSGDSLTPQDLKRAIDSAKKRGFEVVQSKPNLLLVDLDSIAARRQFDRVLKTLREVYPLDGEPEFTDSKSGNQHVVLRLDDPLPVHVRIALQAALGSDGVREVLALALVDNGSPEPSLLFRPKQKKRKAK